MVVAAPRGRYRIRLTGPLTRNHATTQARYDAGDLREDDTANAGLDGLPRLTHRMDALSDRIARYGRLDVTASELVEDGRRR